MNTITCPKCGTSIEVTKALEDEIRSTIEQKVRKEAREETEKAREETAKKVTEELSRKYDLEQQKRLAEVEENHKQNRELREQLLELTKQLQSEKTKSENAELEMRKKLLESQEKMFADAKAKADDEYKLIIAEKNKKIEDAVKAKDELARKLEQGSQQMQGEVQELDLEQSLKMAFPGDVVEPIGKGVLGADVRQIVRTPMGIPCGTILWESKRTKAWSDGWIGKLKDDLLHDKAHIPAIISETLPEEAKTGIGKKDGVWIASPKLAVPLAMLLRQSLLDVAKQRKVQENQQTKAESLYEYVTSPEFVQRMDSMIDTYLEMKKQIQDERNAFERIWKKREMQVDRLLSGANGLYGSMQGIAGQALPTLRSLELPGGRDESSS